LCDELSWPWPKRKEDTSEREEALKNLVQQTLGLYETLHLGENLLRLQDSDRITSAMYASIM
jgi:hypothetical protein